MKTLPPKLASEFNRLTPLRSFSAITWSYALIFIALYIAKLSSSVLISVVVVIVIGSQQYALQIVLHDAHHRRLSKRRFINDWLARLLLCYPFFVPFEAFRKKHIKHHQKLGSQQDPDLYYYTSENKLTALDFLLCATAVRPAICTLVSLLHSKDKAVHVSAKSLDLEWLGVLAFQLTIAGLLSMYKGLFGYFIYWILPFYLGVYFPQALRSFCEHSFLVRDHDYEGNRLVSYKSNVIERCFLAPNSMNFHAEHHLYPSVPFYKLKKLSNYLAQDSSISIERRKSYFSYLVGYIRMVLVNK